MEKVVWFYWAQGWASAPWFVKRNYQSWAIKNSTWRVVFIDDRVLPKYSDAFNFVKRNKNYISTTAFSDVLRLDLLSRYGGVWVDATLLCMGPLDAWLSDAARPSGFFAFRSRCEDRDLASWHLAAERHNHLVEEWLTLTRWYWGENDFNNPDPWMPILDDLAKKFGKSWKATQGYFEPETLKLRVYPYFWINYLHQKLVETDPLAANIWNKTPEVLCGPQSTFLQIDPLLPLDDYTRMIAAKNDVFMLKFDRRAMPQVPPPGSALHALYEPLINSALPGDPTG